jgi:hypothetical protein
VKLEPGQNIFDIAIATGGHIEAVLGIVKDNGISFSTMLEAGEDVEINNPPVDKLIARYFLSRTPATGSVPTVDGANKLEGIDYWAIEQDFIVQ